MAIGPPINVIRYLGEGNVPFDIKNRRKLSLETMRRMGVPVLIKHTWNIDDLAKGLVEEYGSSAYRESTHWEQITHGVGYASLEVHPEEWIDEEGEIHRAPTPEEGWTPAPAYRGYGPGYLTYAILPDAPEDVFKLTPAGALLHTQVSRVQLPWWPLCADNDLLVVVELDKQENIIATHERYNIKQVQPLSMRGENRYGQREIAAANASGNRWWVGQQAEMTKVVDTDPIYQVETDR